MLFAALNTKYIISAEIVLFKTEEQSALSKANTIRRWRRTLCYLGGIVDLVRIF